jgi:cell shape-determining protein MreC
VVDEYGALVGEISVATANAATVVPIIRPTGGVQVVSQTGEEGTLRGQGVATMIFEVNPATEPVFAGYLLKTAGSEKWPTGLPVAKVAESENPEATKIRTEAVPLADFSRMRFVVVLQWTFSQEDQAEEQPEQQLPADEAPLEETDPGGGDS